MVAVARQYFKLPSESARIRLEIADGSEFVQRSEREFDLVLVDGFDAKGGAGMLDTLPFYCNCQARLAGAGLLATNLLRRTRGVRPSMERLAVAFEGRAIALPPCESGNTIAVAAKGPPVERTFAELARAAQRLRIASGLNLVPTVARMKAARVGGERTGCASSPSRPGFRRQRYRAPPLRRMGRHPGRRRALAPFRRRAHA